MRSRQGERKRETGGSRGRRLERRGRRHVRDRHGRLGNCREPAFVRRLDLHRCSGGARPPPGGHRPPPPPGPPPLFPDPPRRGGAAPPLPPPCPAPQPPPPPP